MRRRRHAKLLLYSRILKLLTKNKNSRTKEVRVFGRKVGTIQVVKLPTTKRQRNAWLVRTTVPLVHSVDEAIELLTYTREKLSRQRHVIRPRRCKECNRMLGLSELRATRELACKACRREREQRRYYVRRALGLKKPIRRR